MGFLMGVPLGAGVSLAHRHGAAWAGAIDDAQTSASVAVLQLHRPAPSAWAPAEQRQFVESLSQLCERPDLTAIVLTGDRLFDESGLHPAAVRHGFRLVVDAIADCVLPVIAAIPKDAIGSGLELALACAARAAGPHSTFASTELAAGRLPVHGAIERTPRLVGLGKAAEIIICGARWDARTALSAGLIDAIEPRDLIETAKGLAAAMRPEANAARPKTMTWQTAAAELSSVRQKINRLGSDQAAPLAALKALETAAQLPLRRAVLETDKIAQALSLTDQARALAYAESGTAALAAWGTASTRDALRRRLRWPLLREAIHLLDEGASPGQIDHCLIAYGFAQGPFAESDRLGLNAVFNNDLDPTASPPSWLTYSPTLDLMADAKRLGGDAPGWYHYSEGRPMFDAEVSHIIEASATFQRLTRQPLSDDAVIERCLLAAINACAAELERARRLKKDEIDAVWTRELGFPPWKGGPLFQAEQMGLVHVVERLAAIHARRNTLGAPSEVLARTAARHDILR